MKSKYRITINRVQDIAFSRLRNQVIMIHSINSLSEILIMLSVNLADIIFNTCYVHDFNRRHDCREMVICSQWKEHYHILCSTYTFI